MHECASNKSTGFGNRRIQTTTQEISGGETVGAFGFGYYLKKELLISLGVSYDNNNAILFRPGIEWKFGGKINQLTIKKITNEKNNIRATYSSHREQFS